MASGTQREETVFFVQRPVRYVCTPGKTEEENGKLPRSPSSGTQTNLQAIKQKPTDGNIPLCATENPTGGIIDFGFQRCSARKCRYRRESGVIGKDGPRFVLSAFDDGESFQNTGSGPRIGLSVSFCEDFATDDERWSEIRISTWVKENWALRWALGVADATEG
jgi:hypothetical protein